MCLNMEEDFILFLQIKLGLMRLLVLLLAKSKLGPMFIEIYRNDSKKEIQIKN